MLCTRLILILLVANLSNAQYESMLDLINIQYNINNFKSVITYFRNFSLLFYVENDLFLNTDNILKFTHDNMQEALVIRQDSDELWRFNDLNFVKLLHVIIFTDSSKLVHYLEVSTNIKAEHIILLVVIKDDWEEESFWTIPKLSWAGNVLIMNTTNDYLSLYNVCYYCHKPKILNHLYTGEMDGMKVDRSELFPNTFSNFWGYNFQVGYFNSFPHMLCIQELLEDSLINCTTAVGIEYDMLKVLSKKLNFTYTLMPYTNFDEMKNFTGRRRYNFVIGAVTVTAATAPIMHFTSTTAFQMYTFLYKPTKLSWLEIFDNIRPFQVNVWICVLTTIVLFSFGLFLSLKIRRRRHNFSLTTCFKICLKAALQQVGQINYRALGSQITSYYILALMWFSLLIISTAYKSKLWAISIKNTNLEPSDVDQLLKVGYRFVVNSQSNDVLNDVLSDNDRLTQKIKKKLILRNNICETIDYVLKNKAAMLDQDSIIQYHALLSCEDILKNVYLELRVTKKSLRHGMHVWPMQIGTPYRKSLNKLISQIHSGGFKFKWKSDAVLHFNYTNIPYSQMTANSENSHKILQGFISSFILYALGNFLAIFCFLAELYHERKSFVRNYRNTYIN
ncbi:hypothetical protein FQA39_LY02449 [Lamprigera yunnana]|nr:hypothetical protein FQA39_LY02449 [Lamprigera yunnana]